jgi:RNA polymerase sigma factor (sigma-70 family)
MIFLERVAAMSPEERARCERLLVENQGLARWGANRFGQMTPWLNFDELYGLMLEAVWRAAMTYDPTRSRFSTYAAIWIRQTASYQRARHKPGGMTRAPKNEEPLSLDHRGGYYEDMYREVAAVDEHESFYVEDIIVQTLKGRDRRVIVARIAGFTMSEIGELEGVSAARVGQITHDAEQRLLDGLAA